MSVLSEAVSGFRETATHQHQRPGVNLQTKCHNAFPGPVDVVEWNAKLSNTRNSKSWQYYIVQGYNR